MRRTPLMYLRASVAAALCPAFALAQTPPDAGSSLRDRQQPLTLPAPPTDPLPHVPKVNERAPAANAVRVVVKRFRLTGNTVFDSDTLLPLLADLRGHELSLDELDAAADRVTAYYRKHGYLLTRAYLPAQESDEGEVTIKVLEGRYGAVRVQNDSHVSDWALNAWLRDLQHGEVIDARSLESNLLPVDDLPGIALSTRLSPGANVGESDLTVQAASEPRVSGELAANNYGNRQTGAYLLNGELALASPLRLGDALSLNVMYSNEHELYYQARYDVPFPSFSATHFGVGASRMNYELAGDFEALHANGTANSYDVHLDQGWIRSRSFNLRSELALEQRDLKDDMWDGQVVTRKRSRNIALELSGDWRSDASVDAFSLRGTRGDLQPVSSALSPDAPQGHFEKLHAAWLHLQRLTQRLSLYTSVQGQLAGVNLDSSERIALGGIDGVRAYPTGEASADEGLVASMELRFQANMAWQVKLLADGGWARLQHTAIQGDNNYRHLSGVGAGVDWQPTPKVMFSLTCSSRTGEAAQSDHNERARVWGQIRWGF